MSSIAVLGATGSLGSHVARQALAAGHDLSVMVRKPARLDAELAAKARVEVADLAAAPLDLLSRFADGQQALICCAGVVTEGPKFVALIERIIEAVEAVSAQRRPPCWFMAGAALLDLDGKGRRGVDLPKVRDTYWPHRVNFERLCRSSLDWRLLCPGPMVEQPALGLARLRLSVDVLPAPLPPLARHLPAAALLPLFAWRVPEMIVPYADAAACMLAHTAPGGPLSQRRVGLALPLGMRGRKDQWAAQPRAVEETLKKA